MLFTKRSLTHKWKHVTACKGMIVPGMALTCVDGVNLKVQDVTFRKNMFFTYVFKL